jgi:four helix bundle protein
MRRMRSFRDLDAWKEAHKLVLMVYEATKGFPGEERFGLTSQMRRAAVSVPANVVEGFKRRGVRDKLRFYNVAEGSLEELKYFFILAEGLGYVASKGELLEQSQTVGRPLQGLIRSTERRLPQSLLPTPYFQIKEETQCYRKP